MGNAEIIMAMMPIFKNELESKQREVCHISKFSFLQIGACNLIY